MLGGRQQQRQCHLGRGRVIVVEVVNRQLGVTGHKRPRRLRQSRPRDYDRPQRGTGNQVFLGRAAADQDLVTGRIGAVGADGKNDLGVELLAEETLRLGLGGLGNVNHERGHGRWRLW